MNDVKKKHVILIVTDDQGYGDIGAHGNPWLKTPNLDKLHDTSISLESFHTDPLCAPTRAALMSGRYSFGAGVYSTLNGRFYMKPDLYTMADYFKAGGYRTGMFGKWHLGDTYPYHPHQRGFDVAHSFGGGVIGEIPDYWNNDYYDDTYLVNGVPTKFQGYCTDNWFSSAMTFMDDAIHADQPFFCYIPTNAPHGPFNVDPAYYDKYIQAGVPEKRAKFFGMIESIDENIGRLVAYLKERKVYDNTIITFFGDNGTATGCSIDQEGHLLDGYNANMRGKKGSTYEGAHRNACFITTPGNVLGKSRQVYGLTTHFDLLTTYIDLCHLPKLDAYDQLDGISMYGALSRGETHLNQGRTLVIHNMQRDMPQKYKDYTVLRDTTRLVRPLTLESNPFATGNFGSPATIEPEIYDIEKDPSERYDIYKDNVILANELTLYYEDWYDARVDDAMIYSPMYIRKEEETKLTCHGWHDCVAMCFSQRHTREGIDGTGFWAIRVVDSGEYAIELRRWPRESQLSICASCKGESGTDRKEDKPEGRAYKVVKALVDVCGQRQERDVSLEDKSVVFIMHLEKGDYNMRTRFINEDLTYIGAYYVYIRKQ
ncbi:arylsulfatase [Vallitalea pronyensis]|uniref:Arylsulfatase n=1 Tax=Vallitalea pronyensis TaxID=1348613 RepID=A0A8J8MNS0_9FIRM|nr:arylsulfatase [Vallitalea pronyensis]QUI25322.1 arylsulfatase [Vallitalea pronyensis]